MVLFTVNIRQMCCLVFFLFSSFKAIFCFLFFWEDQCHCFIGGYMTGYTSCPTIRFLDTIVLFLASDRASNEKRHLRNFNLAASFLLTKKNKKALEKISASCRKSIILIDRSIVASIILGRCTFYRRQFVVHTILDYCAASYSQRTSNSIYVCR